MVSPLVKLLPAAAVAVLVAYCIWPEDEPPPREARPAKQNALTPALLQPSAAPVPVRDPFGLKPLGVETVKKTAPRPGAAPVPPSKPALPPVSSLASKAAARTEAARAKVKELVLGATFLRGERRLALINNRFYAEGETLKDAKASGDPKAPGEPKDDYVVAQVHADRVVLRHGAETVDLKFRGLDAKPPAGTAKPPAKTAKPPGLAAKPPKK